ncbi:MAG TPA: OmpA family protein [Kiloniellales bacterium]
MPQHDPQQPVGGATGASTRRAGLRLRVVSGLLLGALVLTAGPGTWRAARADGSGDPVDVPIVDGSASKQGSPLNEELAAKKAAARSAASDAPEPAPVPGPPEQSAGDEALIELPIAPAAATQEEPEGKPAPATAASEGTADPANDGEDLQSLRVLFPADDSHIDAAAESELLRLAGYLNHNQAQRVVLYAHAGGGGQGSSDARRLSLSRALAVRTFLVDRGVPADRIYLRPLGSGSDDGPPDRVDILPLRP